MSAIQVNPLTIDEVLRSESSSLFVVNNTDLGRKRPKGVLHLLIKDSTNTEIPVNLPRTWIPINLATYCEVEAVKKNNVFRDFLRRGILYAISEDQAKQVLNTAEAQAEVKKVVEQENSMNAAMRASVDTTKPITIFGGSDPEPAALTNGNAGNPAHSTLHPEIVTLVNDFNNGDDDIATSRRVLSIVGDKDSWIWASSQIQDTSSAVYLAIVDKLGEFS